MFGILGGCVVAAVLLREIAGYPLVGEVVYWGGVLGFFAVGLGTSVTLFDERDTSLERRASQLTLGVLAPILAVVASAARLIPRLTDYAVPSGVWYALYGVIAVYLLFGVVYTGLRLRS